MSKVYLSGPMTGIPEFNFPMFDAAARALREDWDYEVVSPAEHDRAVVNEAWLAGRTAYQTPEQVPGYAEGDVVTYASEAGSVHDLLAWDFQQIMKCDGIALMPGWEHSSGARAERLVAEATGKYVLLVTPNPDNDVWHIESPVEQRALMQYMAEYPHLTAAGATEHPSMLHAVEQIMRREIETAERWHEDHSRSILAAITDDVPPLTPTGEAAARGEIRVIDPKTGGAKGSKPQAMHLLPGDALLAISEHLDRGAKKYAERNWELGYAWSLSFASMQRHLWAWWQGQDNDPEFGWSHLRAVGFHALVLLAFELRGAGTDDRPGEHCQCCDDGSHTPPQRWEASDLR